MLVLPTTRQTVEFADRVEAVEAAGDGWQAKGWALAQEVPCLKFPGVLRGLEEEVVVDDAATGQRGAGGGQREGRLRKALIWWAVRDSNPRRPG